MSSVQQFNGGVNWTIENVFNGYLKKSQPFIMKLNGQDVTFTLSSAFVYDSKLTHMRGYSKTLNGTLVTGGP